MPTTPRGRPTGEHSAPPRHEALGIMKLRGSQAVQELRPEATTGPQRGPRRLLPSGASRRGLIAAAVVVLAIAATQSHFVGLAVVIGLTEHAPLVLAATGFALLYRLTGLINVAYAETITLGAYFAVWLNSTLGLGFFVALVPAGLLAGLLSVATYLLIFRPAQLRGVGSLELIIISFGLSVALRYGLQFVFGYPVRFFEIPPPRTVQILGVGVASFRIVALVSVLLLALVLYLFIQKSRYGLRIRALASDSELAEVSGIRPLAVTVVIWFIAGVAGGMAGAFYGVGSSVAPLLGWRVFLFILLVVLVGGIWGLNGVIGVGLCTGIALAAMTLKFGEALYAQLVLIAAFLIVLKFWGRRLTESTKV